MRSRRERAVTLRLASDGGELAIEIAGVGELSLEQPLQRLDGAGVELGASPSPARGFSRAPDDPEAVVVLTKTLPSPAT